MTQFYTLSDLEHLTETQLRAKLCELFNALAGLQTAMQEYAIAIATLEDVQKALRRKLSGLRP